VEFDTLTAEIAEHWADVRLSSEQLTGLNDHDYCYAASWFVIRFRGVPDEHSYFRGIWPSRFADADLLRAAPVKECRRITADRPLRAG